MPATAHAGDSGSVCFVTTAAGRLENGKRLPRSGANFRAYSDLGVLLGRTFVHDRVHRVVVAAYAALAESMPDVTYVYGESGFREGGPFEPHKTHQNGLSIDHMVPVLDSRGRSVAFPAGAFNKLGYAVEFDDRGFSWLADRLCSR